MSEELDILRLVADNPSISQRKIAEKTGISLGQVNFLIKKCAKKGLIKIEGQTAKSIKYNLTPKGIAEKAALTLEYIKISYAAIIAISSKVRQYSRALKENHIKIYLFGSHDEMMELIQTVLKEEQIDYDLIPYSDSDGDSVHRIEFKPESGSPYDILCWSNESAEYLKDYNFTNILI